MACLTQEDLARAARLGVRTIRDLERERSRPRGETVRLLAAALRLEEAARQGFEQLASGAGHPAPQPAGIPIPPTPLIGRSREVDQVVTRLQGAGRLLTLTGPPGVGKTHLALTAAPEVDLGPRTERVFVDLAPLLDPLLVGTGLAQAMGVQTGGTNPWQDLGEHIDGRPVIVVLDNFEHLLGAATPVGELLARCPALRVLVTTRASLQLRGELRLPVEPLPLPDAVSLFVERARARAPDLEFDSRMMITVAEICRRLEGLPLAIELATAWLELLAPGDLLQRLDRRLAILDAPVPDLPERQHAMASTLDWSYKLLAATEQRLFRSLSVFVGGASLEAIETVCGAAAGNPQDVLRTLGGLVDKSLARRELQDGELRIVMLETVREYARERLERSGELAAVSAAHLDHFAARAVSAKSELRGPDQAAWLTRLARDHDNLRAALRWALNGGEVEIGARLACSLWRFWDLRGHGREGEAWLERFAERDREMPVEVRADVLCAAGGLAQMRADRPVARARLEASLELSRAVDHRRGVANALNALAITAFSEGDLQRAARLFEDCVAAHEAVGDRWATAVARNNLANCLHHLGNHLRALSMHLEALAIRRELDDKHGIAMSLSNMGETALYAGMHEQAREWLKESVTLCRELGAQRSLSIALANIGQLDRVQGDHPSAFRSFQESLRIADEIGYLSGVCDVLESIAATRVAQGVPVAAARLCGGVSSLREASGIHRQLVDEARYDTTVARIGEALDEDTCAAAWAAGRALSRPGVVAEALGGD